MSSILHRRTTRAVLAATALALAAGLGPIAVADDVSQDDIDKSKAAESSTSASIATLEAQLSQLNASLNAAQISAEKANEDYLVALDDLNQATTSAQTAQTNADNAKQETTEARTALGSVVVQTYQEGGNPLDMLTPYLTSESLADLADQNVALMRAGENSDAKVQGVEALQAVADTMQSIADSKVVAKQTAADTAQSAKATADTAAAQAQAAVTDAETKRTNLISQLATQRNTTVELETQYQNQREAERKSLRFFRGDCTSTPMITSIPLALTSSTG